MISLNSINSSVSSVEIKSESGQALSIDGSGYITSNINGTVTVSATDLDIRNLVFATDKVDASGSSVSVSNTVAVSSTDLDIRDLTQTDEITAYQGGTWTVVVDTVSSWKTSAQSVTGTASELAATPLANRSKLEIQNLGNRDVFISTSNAVTLANGFLIPSGSSYSESLSADVDIWAIAESGTQDIRIAEYAA